MTDEMKPPDGYVIEHSMNLARFWPAIRMASTLWQGTEAQAIAAARAHANRLKAEGIREAAPLLDDTDNPGEYASGAAVAAWLLVHADQVEKGEHDAEP